MIKKCNKSAAELRPIPAETPGTLGDFLSLRKRDPYDAKFADDLERANSKELPDPNPWGCDRYLGVHCRDDAALWKL
jgi:hypothetical protein